MLRALSFETMASPDRRQRVNSLPTPIQKVLGIVRRHFWIIFCCLLIVFGGGVVYLLILRPTYTATATMLIESRQGGIQQKSVLGDASPSDSAWMDSQIGILNLERFPVAQSV